MTAHLPQGFVDDETESTSSGSSALSIISANTQLVQEMQRANRELVAQNQALVAQGAQSSVRIAAAEAGMYASSFVEAVAPMFANMPMTDLTHVKLIEDYSSGRPMRMFEAEFTPGAALRQQAVGQAELEQARGQAHAAILHAQASVIEAKAQFTRELQEVYAQESWSASVKRTLGLTPKARIDF